MIMDGSGDYILWQNYGYEGWQGHRFETLAQAMEGDRHQSEWMVTKYLAPAIPHMERALPIEENQLATTPKDREIVSKALALYAAQVIDEAEVSEIKMLKHWFDKSNSYFSLNDWRNRDTRTGEPLPDFRSRGKSQKPWTMPS